MKWGLIVIAVIVGVFVIMAVIGSFLPKGHTAVRTAVFRAPAGALWSTITDFAAAPGWRADLKRVEVLPPRDGRTLFREESRHGAVLFEVEEAIAEKRLVTRIADPDLAFGGSWTIELSSDGGGTRVTITERGEVKNPIFRFLSNTVFSQHATIETYLRALGKKHGEAVTPGPEGGEQRP